MSNLAVPIRVRTSFPPRCSTGAERTDMERFYEGVGRCAPTRLEGQHCLDLPSGNGRNRHRHRRGGVVN